MGVCGSTEQKPKYTGSGTGYTTASTTSQSTPTSADRRAQMSNAIQSRSKPTASDLMKAKKTPGPGLYGDLGESGMLQILCNTSHMI